MDDGEEARNKKQDIDSFGKCFQRLITYIISPLAAVALIVVLILLSLPVVSGILFGLDEMGFVKDKAQVIYSLRQINAIPNETLLTILSLLIAFTGLLAYVFKEIVRKNLEEELRKKIDKQVNIFNKKIWTAEKEIKDERIASRVDSILAIALSLLYVYQSTHDVEKLKYLFNKKKESNLITRSVLFGKTAQRHLNKIQEKEKYANLFLRAKNNRALSLAFYLQPSQEDIADAANFSKENYDFAQKNNMQGEIPKYIFEATRALVLLRFSKNSGEAEKIYKNLLRETNQDGISVSNVPKWAREEIKHNKMFVEKIKEVERYGAKKPKNILPS